MRSKIIRVFIVSILFIEIFQLFSMKEEKYSSRKAGITVIVPIASTGYWSRIADEITGVCEEDNIDVKCVGFQKADVEKQIKAIQCAIWSGTKGIIIAGIEDTDEIREIFVEATEKNIPVVLIDSDLPESGRACYVGTDNYKAGKIAGEELIRVSKTKEKGKILVIVSDLDNRNQKERVEGFCSVINQYKDMFVEEIFEGNSNEVYIQDNVSKILKENG